LFTIAKSVEKQNLTLAAHFAREWQKLANHDELYFTRDEPMLRWCCESDPLGP